MPKLPFVKISPWMLAAEAGVAMHRRWKDLEAHEQRRLRELLPKAHQLSAREREELRRLLVQLDMVGVGRELLPVVGKRYKRRAAKARAARR